VLIKKIGFLGALEIISGERLWEFIQIPNHKSSDTPDTTGNKKKLLLNKIPDSSDIFKIFEYNIIWTNSDIQNKKNQKNNR
jgi:hypothetical protein